MVAGANARAEPLTGRNTACCCAGRVAYSALTTGATERAVLWQARVRWPGLKTAVQPLALPTTLCICGRPHQASRAECSTYMHRSTAIKAAKTKTLQLAGVEQQTRWCRHTADLEGSGTVCTTCSWLFERCGLKKTAEFRKLGLS